MANVCRCGWEGTEYHPCHYSLYSCRKPAKERLYFAGFTCLAGAQPKVGANQTFACDEHWKMFCEDIRIKDLSLSSSIKEIIDRVL